MRSSATTRGAGWDPRAESVGLLVVDPTDDPQQRRLTLAHEAAHFIVDYLTPRRQVARRLPELLDVLDCERQTTKRPGRPRRGDHVSPRRPRLESVSLSTDRGEHLLASGGLGPVLPWNAADSDIGAGPDPTSRPLQVGKPQGQQRADGGSASGTHEPLDSLGREGQPDLASKAGHSPHPDVGGQEGTAEGLGQCQVGGVVATDVGAHLPHAFKKRPDTHDVDRRGSKSRDRINCTDLTDPPPEPSAADSRERLHEEMLRTGPMRIPREFGPRDSPDRPVVGERVRQHGGVDHDHHASRRTSPRWMSRSARA